ncbi:MAG: hypothetical protein IKR46_02360, partial [Clostridia bacterium]|nr:hypothetical protein [Clostridia bacterium]
GDFFKEHIKFVRNRTFLETDTLKADKRLVYRETGKEYSNYWFSSSDGMRLKSFLKLLTKEKVDRLIENGGCAIVYTHFAYDFVGEDGQLNKEFEKTIDYISSKNGWFVPASELLEYVLKDNDFEPSKCYERKMDMKWLLQRILKMGD